MLYEFVTTYRDAIIERAREKVTARPWPAASDDEIKNGVPLFLTQLADTLEAEAAGTPHSPHALGATATRHGRELMALGFTASQVVHDYGDICQAVSEVAIEHGASITTDEFKTLNRCLDTATAEAVTEHARITAEARSSEESERAGHIAHESRDLLNTALLAYQSIKSGKVAVNGSTSAVLGRSLMALRDLIDHTLADIRMAASEQRRERILVTPFLREIAAAGWLHSEARGLQFSTELGHPALAVTADPLILASAVSNLLNNAFKFTPEGGHVILRARTNAEGRLLIEVEDECGGIPLTDADPFKPFGARRGLDRSGLGLGLSIARKAVRAHGGDIHVRNVPGKGCVFVIDVALAAEDVAAD